MSRLITGLLAVAALSGASGVEAQTPDTATLAELAEGTRIRTNGPAVRDVIRPTFREVLDRGFMTLFIRPPVEGVVVDASDDSFRFAASSRSQLVDVPWSGLESVDVYGGRSPALGALQGAGGGALAGLVMWGMIEFMFMWADNPVVEEVDLLVGLSAAAGGLYGAATMGHTWDQVYPTPR